MGLLRLSTVTFGADIVVGRPLHSGVCTAAPLVSTHWLPVASPLPKL